MSKYRILEVRQHTDRFFRVQRKECFFIWVDVIYLPTLLEAQMYIDKLKAPVYSKVVG